MEKLDSDQLDQLKEIGTYLRQVRQEQSKSLEEIATKTCIRLPLLRAIELGQDQVLPEPVFVQGFIRRYADVLGLDGIGISRTFPVHSPLIDNDLKIRGDSGVVAYAAPVTETLEESKYSLRSSREFSEPSGGFWQSKAAYALYGLLGLGAIGYVAYALLHSGQSQPAISTPPTALTQSPLYPSPLLQPLTQSPSSKSSVAPSQVSAPSPVKPAVESVSQAVTPASPAALPADLNAPVKVEMKLIGRSWVQVMVDGEIQFEGTLAEGTQRSWSAKKAITVVAGNAGAVSVLANDGTAVPMGNLGDVQEKTFTVSTRQ